MLVISVHLTHTNTMNYNHTLVISLPSYLPNAMVIIIYFNYVICLPLHVRDF